MATANPSVQCRRLTVLTVLGMNAPNNHGDCRPGAGVLVFVQSDMVSRVRSAFACTGVGLREAGSLAEALHVLASKPPLVVTSINKAGFELFRTARACYPDIEVVMVEQESLN